MGRCGVRFPSSEKDTNSFFSLLKIESTANISQCDKKLVYNNINNYYHNIIIIIIIFINITITFMIIINIFIIMLIVIILIPLLIIKGLQIKYNK